MNICFIGGGNMATAILAGLQANHVETRQMGVVEPSAEKRAALSAQFQLQTHENMGDFMSHYDSVMLAVKPQQLQAVCQTLRPLLKRQLVVSIAAGVRSADISRWLGGYDAIVRVMPNTPAQIQAGVSALYAMPAVSSAQRAQTDALLSAVGKTIWLDDEANMDAVTAISGSGPAYVFYWIEGMIEAGVTLGLSPDQSRLLALETFKGASLLACASTVDVSTLRAQVTSKGGTTEQGILSLENAQTKAIILEAVQAAALKSVALGDVLGQA